MTPLQRRLTALFLLCILAIVGVADAVQCITIRTTTFSGQPIANATVKIQPLASTYGTLEALWAFLSLPPGSAITHANLTGTTDANGAITFLVADSVQYRVTAQKPNEINKTQIFYPESDASILVIQDTDIGRAFFGRQATNIARARNVSVSVATHTLDDTHAHIIVTYTDSTAQPAQTFFNLTGTNISPNSQFVNIAAGRHTQTFDVDLSICQHFTIGVFDIPNPDNPQPLDRTFDVSFKKSVLAPLGIDPLLIFLVGAFLLLLTGMLFTATSVEIGALVTCFVGWILYALGFFVYLDTQPPLGPATVPTALTFGTVVAILAIIRLRERKEGLA